MTDVPDVLLFHFNSDRRGYIDLDLTQEYAPLMPKGTVHFKNFKKIKVKKSSGRVVVVSFL